MRQPSYTNKPSENFSVVVVVEAIVKSIIYRHLVNLVESPIYNAKMANDVVSFWLLATPRDSNSTRQSASLACSWLVFVLVSENTLCVDKNKNSVQFTEIDLLFPPIKVVAFTSFLVNN